MNPLIGNLLGDGSLRFTHKGLDGKSKFNSNALYTMTLKDKDYIYPLPPSSKLPREGFQGKEEAERDNKDKDIITNIPSTSLYIHVFYLNLNKKEKEMETHIKI